MNKKIMKYGSFITLIVLIIVLMMTYFFRKALIQEKLEKHDFYQYLSGIRFDYNGNLKIANDNNVTALTFNDVTVMLDSTPLYYRDEKKVLFPKNMSITYPLSNATQYRINYFSRIVAENDEVYLLDGKKQKALSNSFLYDGKDLYFFLEETTIKFKNQQIVLSPFSYVIVTYNDSLQIYDYKQDKYENIALKNDEVIASSKGYTINLGIDSVVYNSNSRLLIKNMNYLKIMS